MGSILVLEAKGAERDKDKARRGGVELLSASAATRLQDEKACSLPLRCLCSSFRGAQREGSICHLSYSISGGSTLCVILAFCCCNANKEVARFSDRQNVTCPLPQRVCMCVCARVCVCARKRWVVGWGWVLAQGESRLPLRPASDEFI